MGASCKKRVSSVLGARVSLMNSSKYGDTESVCICLIFKGYSDCPSLFPAFEERGVQDGGNWRRSDLHSFSCPSQRSIVKVVTWVQSRLCNITGIDRETRSNSRVSNLSGLRLDSTSELGEPGDVLTLVLGVLVGSFSFDTESGDGSFCGVSDDPAGGDVSA